MKTYKVYETVTNIFGKSTDYFCGTVDARNEQSALNKAKRLFKYEHSGGEYGAFTRRRNPENLYVELWADHYVCKEDYYEN